jgi:hypothetical protein
MFSLHISFLCFKVKVKVTLRLTVSQSVSLGVESHLGPMTRYLLLCDNYGLVLVGRPLWREDGFAFFMCCWLLPAQSFSGPSPLGLETIFYCLTFETFLFVASYDSQGHGGGIRPRLHTGIHALDSIIPLINATIPRWSFSGTHPSGNIHEMYCVAVLISWCFVMRSKNSWRHN